MRNVFKSILILGGILGLLGLAQATTRVGPVDAKLPDLDGEFHSLTDYRGKWVILNFWATWCSPCLEEIPELSIFHEQNKDAGAVVIGVNFEDIERGKLADFMDEQFMDYPMLRMAPSATTPFGQIHGLPTTYVISPKGHLTRVHVGSVTSGDLESYIRPGH